MDPVEGFSAHLRNDALPRELNAKSDMIHLHSLSHRKVWIIVVVHCPVGASSSFPQGNVGHKHRNIADERLPTTAEECSMYLEYGLLHFNDLPRLLFVVQHRRFSGAPFSDARP